MAQKVLTWSNSQSNNSRCNFHVPCLHSMFIFRLAHLFGPGGHSYIIEGMDVRQGLSNPYPSQAKISANFWTFCSQMAEKFRKYIP